MLGLHHEAAQRSLLKPKVLASPADTHNLVFSHALFDQIVQELIQGVISEAHADDRAHSQLLAAFIGANYPLLVHHLYSSITVDWKLLTGVFGPPSTGIGSLIVRQEGSDDLHPNVRLSGS